MTTWTVKRTLPSGAVRTQSGFKTRKAAARQAGICLHNNTGCSKAEAQRFSVELDRNGTACAHGYTFELIPAEISAPS